MGIKVWWPLLFVGSIILACLLIFPSDLRLADLFGRAGKYDEAIKKYQILLSDDPLRTSARLELSKLYILNGEPKKAVLEIERAGVEQLDDVFFLTQIADIYSQLGEKEKTISTLEKIVSLDPDNLDTRRRLAEAYDWNEETEKAGELYADWLAKNPNDAEVLNKLAHVYLKQKRYKESLPYLTKLAELRPNDSRPRILLADVYIELDQKRRAAAEFEKVMKIHPGNQPARRRLAELYLWLEDFGRGLENYEYLVKTNPTNIKYFDRYTELAYDLAPDKAIHYHRQRLEQNPRDEQLRERFASLFLHVGDTDNAIQQMNILLAANSNAPKYYKLLANLYQDLREPHLANKMFEIMFEKGLDDSEVAEELLAYYETEKEYDKLLELYSALFDQGKIDENIVAGYADLLFRIGHYNDAAKQYAKLTKLRPDSAEYRIQLAELYQLDGQTNEAARVLWDGVKKHNLLSKSYLLYSAQFLAEHRLLEQSIGCYEKLASIAPDNLQYKKLLVSHYTENKDFGKAMRLQRQILMLKPGDSTARFELASLCWLQNDFETMHLLMDEFDSGSADGSGQNRKIGQFYFERSFYNKAIEYFTAELQASPDDSSSLRMLGLAYAWNNQPKQSIGVLAKYNRLYPYDFFTHFEVGELLVGERKYAAAANEFQTALDLIGVLPETRETQVTRAKIYAHQKQPEKAEAEFENLLATYPNDVPLLIDYAESLVNLRSYQHASTLLARALELDPDNYRAFRLQSRGYYEQGKYKAAAHILKDLLYRFPADTGLRLDMAESELAAGDWYRSEKTLKAVLRLYPKNLPAQERLILLRRQRSQALSVDYSSSKQSDNLFKQMYNVVVAKAKSSWLHLKFMFGEEKYTTQNNSLGDVNYRTAGAEMSSSFGNNLQTEISAKMQHHGDNWYIAGKGRAVWNFNPSTTVSFSVNKNDLWSDPFTAAFHQGRLDRYQSELNLSLFKDLYLWNRFSYEQHKYRNGHFGDSRQSYLQIGRRWNFQPQLSTYYQLYHLKYAFGAQAAPNLIAIPGKDLVHSLGGNLEQQLSGKLYYHLGGSIGFSSEQNSMNYYGSAGLEYTILNRMRLRSLLEYGRQGQLASNDKTTSLWFDLSYFY